MAGYKIEGTPAVIPPPKDRAHCPWCGKALAIRQDIEFFPNQRPRYKGTWSYGRTINSYTPFCSAQCAVEFGKAAYRTGYRRP